MHPLQGVVLLCASLYIQSKVVQYLYFKPKMCGSKPKSSSDVAGSAKKCQLSYCTMYFSRHCNRIKNVYFLCLVSMCYLCEKYYKPITV